MGNFLDITLGNQNIDKVLLGSSLIWERPIAIIDTGLDKDYSGTGWYKALDTGIVYNKGIPEGETYIFSGDPIEYISVYTKSRAVAYASRAATSNITDMSSLFKSNSRFNTNISHWDTSNVTDMSTMFQHATAFNQDIGNWNTSNITNMSSMFLNATAFNQDIGDWDTSNVTNMIYTFYNATAFNQDLSKWCVSKITAKPSFFDTGTTQWTLPRPVWGTCPRGENGL